MEETHTGPASQSRPTEEIHHIKPDGTIRSRRLVRPFSFPNRTLAEILLTEHTAPALIWLLGRKDEETPCMLVGSSWEVALTLSAALEALAFEKDSTYSSFVDTVFVQNKVNSMCTWLIDHQEHHADGSGCWDHSAWDTAVIVRALAGEAISGNFKEYLPDYPERTLAIRSGLLWLISRFMDSKTGKLTSLLNPGDLAEAGRTIVAIAMSDPDLLNRVLKEMSIELNIVNILHEMVTVLIRRQSEYKLDVSFQIDGEVIASGVWWDDYFGTASVLLFLSRFIELDELGICKIDPQTITEIQRSLARCFLLIEDAQTEFGLWGAYPDTIVTLSSYVYVGAPPVRESRATMVRLDLIARPRVVFRALRWMCDPTLTMSDGSLLHTAFLTTFYVITLFTVIRFWPHSQDPMIEIYDELSLILDRGSSQDRASYLAATIERDVAREEMNTAMTREAEIITKVKHEKRIRIRVYWTLIITLFSIILTVIWGKASGSFIINYTPTFMVSDLNIFIGITALIATIALGIIALIWTDFGR